MPDPYADPGDPEGLYLSGPANRTVHRGDCRSLRLPHTMAMGWDAADGQPFYLMRALADAEGLHLCKHCRPAAGDGRVRTAGPWSMPFNSGHANPIPEIRRADRARLVFDPPNILFIPGGARIRVESFETDSPVLAVERFDRTVDRYRLRVDGPHPAP